MYKIIKNGATIGLTENLNYITRAENGCLVLCPEPLATGIVFEGTAFHLLGRESLEGVESVALEHVDGGLEITKANEIGGVVFATLAEAGSIDTATMADHAELFAEWAYPINYATGQICRYEGKLFKCIQGHTSQTGWTPAAAVSQWAMIADPSEEWPAWIAPVGAFDAYQAGDKVSHKERHWASTADNNVWEPGMYGWEEAADGV